MVAPIRMAGQGWAVYGPDPRIAAWAEAAREVSLGLLAASVADWRCGNTWFVGVDALPNGPDGAVGDVAFPWVALPLDPEPLHPGQLSVMRPGYPQPSPSESEAALRFRVARDAAHLDGLLLIPPGERRYVKEPHGWILGLPLNQCGPDASPLVVWDGSHEVMRAALLDVLDQYPAHDWDEVEVTETYKAARRRVFDTCQRVELPARPGEATLIHRLMLHGVAPWTKGAVAPPEGRMIAYFRPQMASVEEWLRKV
ncbi:hypothetical protein [Tabrizicola sp. BL-A-41-H6]|uniref:hypothetical protein n=1 Tax=Tabrizicola sp. BL-A-41-H6 TaxID=3421107 RepID=UPI003D67D57B